MSEYKCKYTGQWRTFKQNEGNKDPKYHDSEITTINIMVMLRHIDLNIYFY